MSRQAWTDQEIKDLARRNADHAETMLGEWLSVDPDNHEVEWIPGRWSNRVDISVLPEPLQREGRIRRRYIFDLADRVEADAGDRPVEALLIGVVAWGSGNGYRHAGVPDGDPRGPWRAQQALSVPTRADAIARIRRAVEITRRDGGWASYAALARREVGKLAAMGESFFTKLIYASGHHRTATPRPLPLIVDTNVAGSEVVSARVELNSATHRADARVTETGQVSLPLPDGLPPGAWLYLSRERRWLDYRAIGECRAPAELAHAGVEVEIAEDPESEIQALLARGEGLQVEFKRQLPENSDESKRTVFKTVAAFANGHGGSIVFGVEKDEATMCGLDGIDLITERDRLAQLARSIVDPAPDVEVRQYEHDGKTLLVLTVSRGSDPPYGITLPGKKDKPVEFYIRRDATTFPARPDEIRNAVLAAAPPPAAIPSWGY
jgi:Putative DNA-binding domain